MQSKIILIYLLLFFYSCNKLPESKGMNNEITIVSSKEDKEFIELFFTPLLEKNIYTPTIENLYILNFIDADNFDINKYKKNIIIISLDHPKDLNVDLLSKKIREQYDDQPIFSIYDLYAKNQIVISLFSHDATKLSFDIEKNKEWIINEIDKNIELNILNGINKFEIERDITTKIKDIFKIDILIDENYKLIKIGNDFLWIGRGYPYRWIVINQIDINMVDQANYVNFIKEFFEEKLSNILISDYMLNISNNNIIRGVYEHNESQTGGPFFSYIYENSHNNKVIFVSGFVNNPGKSKGYLLLQLETIIKNIRILDE